MKLQPLEKDKYYHIFNRGINSNPIFFSTENKSYFLKKLKQYLADDVKIYAYCLLNNHFHLAVEICADSSKVTQSFSNFLNAYAKAINKQENRTGSLFEKHFKRIELNSEEYLKQLIVYIHLNPKLHYDYNFENYTYSSYSSFFSEKPTHLERIQTFQLFGGKENFKYVHLKKNIEIEERLILE